MHAAHGLLRRQLSRIFGGEEAIPAALEEFLKVVDRTYQEFDADRAILERSIELSSQEILNAYSEMRTILRAFPDLVFRIDRSGVIVDCRGGVDSEFWFPPNRLVGSRLADIPDPAVAAQFEAAAASIRRTGEPCAIEYTLALNGRSTAHEARLIPVDDEHTVIVVRNITTQRRAAEDLAHQRRFLRDVIDLNPHFIFAKDRRGRFTLANKSVAEAYGTTADELLGRTDADFNANESEVEAFRADDLEVIRSGLEMDIPRERITDATGTPRWLWTIKRPIPAPDGDDTHVLGIATDITRRVQAEEDLRERNARMLRHQEALHRLALLDHADMDSMLHTLVSTAAEVTSCRRSVVWLYTDDRTRLECRILWEAGQVSHPDLVMDVAGHPRYVRAIESSRALALTDARTDPRSSELAAGYLVPLGIDARLDLPIWLNGTMAGIVSLEHSGGCREWTPEEVMFVASIADFVALALVTRKREELENELRQSQKMEAIGHLAGGIAHDFNNLLTAINGEAQLLLKSRELSERARHRAGQILHAGERAAGLTRQLLAFSRKQVVSPQVVDVNIIIQNLAPMLKRVIGEDVAFTTVLASDLPLVRIDPGQVEQILVNLAVNARDAMPGGGRIKIETHEARVESAEGCVTLVALKVSDSGCGMDAHTLAHAFEPFFTTKEAGRGTGLGLSTVYGIVQQNRGRIDVTSRPGEGTQFLIQFPAETAGATSAAAPEAPGEEVVSGHETILVVEDEDAVRQIVSEILEIQGYQVRVAAGPAEAIEISGSHAGRIHLMLTDVIMPGMNGHDLYRAIHPQRPDMAVLFMSGYTDGNLMRHNQLDPDVDLIQKPFTFEALSQRVRAAMDQHEAGTGRRGRPAA